MHHEHNYLGGCPGFTLTQSSVCTQTIKDSSNCWQGPEGSPCAKVGVPVEPDVRDTSRCGGGARQAENTGYMSTSTKQKHV